MTGPDSWPDADMLQIGKICKRGPLPPERYSNFTEDEMLTHITLWMICRSPMMMGGHLPENTPFVKKLLTTKEVIEVNQQGTNQEQLFRKDGQVAWIGDAPGGISKYLAIFNLNKEKSDISVSWKEMGLKGSQNVRDLWEGTELGKMKSGIKQTVNPHGTKLFKIYK